MILLALTTWEISYQSDVKLVKRLEAINSSVN